MLSTGRGELLLQMKFIVDHYCGMGIVVGNLKLPEDSFLLSESDQTSYAQDSSKGVNKLAQQNGFK